MFVSTPCYTSLNHVFVNIYAYRIMRSILCMDGVHDGYTIFGIVVDVLQHVLLLLYRKVLHQRAPVSLRSVPVDTYYVHP